MLLQENVPLAPLTTFRLGGPARFLVEAKSAGEIEEAVAFAHAKNLTPFVLGGGSNLLVSDSGWPGLVLQIAIPGIERRSGEVDGKALFEVGAGELWDRFVSHAVLAQCAGIECLSGIPGSVGGTPVQNVGAYGQEVAETISSVQALDLRDGQARELCNEACGFEYRTSIFNTSEKGHYIILRVTYVLRPGGEPRIEYADVRKYFAERRPTLVETREAVRQIRASKSMLITPGDEDARSAGSFFKNPVLSASEHLALAERAAARSLQIPSYPALEARRKISAAWLVEQSGLHKGYTRGPVGISRKHALAIVNRGGAKAADVIALKNEIHQRVLDCFGVQLHPEPVFVGFDQ